MEDRKERERKFYRGWLERLPRRGHVYTREQDPRVQDVTGVEDLPSHPENLPHLSSPVSLSIILFAVLVYVAWGLLVFYTVGTQWPPPWSFGEVQDLPGASVYSTETGKQFLGAGPKGLQSVPPRPQHVEEKPVAPPLRGPDG